jgi:hypothetical protein
MIRYLAGALLVPMLAGAAILPETVGPYKRATVAQALLTDRPIWQEYGLKDAETAVFENGKAKFTATAYRLQDSTGAMAAFQWQRPPKSTPAKGGAQAAETPDSLLAQQGNYVLSFAGYKPAGPELDAVFGTLLNVDPTTLPALPTFLPARNLLANSERYILGPAGLERFVPGIPPSTAAFHTGVEAQAAAFGGPKGR